MGHETYNMRPEMQEYIRSERERIMEGMDPVKLQDALEKIQPFLPLGRGPRDEPVYPTREAMIEDLQRREAADPVGLEFARIVLRHWAEERIVKHYPKG